ncbi:putative bacteriophage DNA transposition protein B [Desulfobulbus propionicus DSM 2032]|uniref:Bacteriophage DNA transposition protein B n=1 Tax=Desulfobulbus propionicus (strain ATCC 33891 / DSM 2032 / VKM B-1956 / 1pr3) TaxID=577650 RepID=A0A7U4DPZ9_DESPD|nr:Mor transcription activator family protein [Desulfobulbus propionicus]ADW18594.1 putative bacteriophage DNA transposition protein B [Desulfobulbus propionicus DSM 2032]
MSRPHEIIDLPPDAWPRLEELNGDMRTIAELIGIGNALKLAQRFDGTPVRIYGWKTWTRSWRDRCIRSDYDTGKYSGVELARKYGLQERQIWNILGRSDGRQLRLF